MAAVEFDDVTKRYADQTLAVDAFCLSIADGELMVLVGPSGCGKSTLLRIVAGLEQPTEGTVRIGGRVANDLSPGDRDVAMVFQDYALYPHMTAHKNMAFALTAQRLSRAEIDRRVREAARVLGIGDLLHRRPRALSGGERQRVALGRAIVRQPGAFLMDEPLSNLDAKLRVLMRAELRRLHDELCTTFLYVTHDQVEAMTLGDRVAVLDQGVLQQVASPRKLYAEPANAFVAGFIGSPPMNLFRSVAESVGGQQVARVGSWCVPLPRPAPPSGVEVVLGIRAERFCDPSAEPASPDAAAHEVVVDAVESLGATALVHFRMPGALLWSKSAVQSATPVSAVASVPGGTTARAGTRMALAVDGADVLLFDAVSGGRLVNGDRSAQPLG